MRLNIIAIVFLLLSSCTTDKKELSSKIENTTPKVEVATLQNNVNVGGVKDSSLFGNWIYEKVPDYKGASSEDQSKMKQVFGSTELVLTESDYTLSMMGTMDTGTWRSLKGETYELKSASGKTQEVKLRIINDQELIFTFLGDKEIQMRKS